MRGKAILFSLLIAATAVSTQAQTLNVAKKGDKAVLFNFVGLSALNLNAYQGGIGGKYFLSNRLALRGMLLFGIDNTTVAASSLVSESKNDNLSVGINAGLEYHLALASRISPYVGGTVLFENTQTTVSPGLGSEKTTTFGAGLIGGVEYFFSQNISLSAEYQFGVSDAINSAAGSSNQTEVKVGFQTTGLTLAAYF